MEEFPDTLIKAINTVSTHNVQPKTEIQKTNQNNNNKKQEIDFAYEIEIPRFAFMTMEERCYCCGKKGHKSPHISSTLVFCNEKYCSNIIPSKTLEIRTNGG